MRTYFIIKTLGILIFSLYLQSGIAQIDELGLYQDTVENFRNEVEPDSVYFFVRNRFDQLIQIPRHETDSALNFWVYDPAQSARTDAFNLGNIGSPTLAAYPDFHRKPGLDWGLSQLDFIRMDSDSVRFYETGKPYTYISYNQAPQQTKSSTHVRFGRTFFDNSGLSIIYNRINDVGEYANQSVRSTSLGIGAHFYPSSSTRIYFSVLTNQLLLNENGGITTDTFFGKPVYEDREVYPVYLSAASMEFKEREGRINIYKTLGSETDSIKNHLDVFYDGRYNFSHYKYFDKNFNEAFYGIYSINENGVRAFIEERTIRNQLGLSFNYKLFKAAESTGRLTASIEHQLHNYDLDNQTFKVNNLLLNGLFFQELSNRLTLQASLTLGLADHVGDYKLEGRLKLKIREGLKLHGFIKSSSLAPSILNKHFIMLNQVIYDNNLNNTKYNSLGATLDLSKQGLYAELTNTLLSDHIYFSPDLVPVQISGSFNVLQMRFGINRRLGIFYTENSLSLQNSSDDALPLPAFMSKHYLGIKFKMFKQRLNMNCGMEAHVIPDFDGYAYFPLLGQFYPSNSTLEYGYRINGLIGIEVDQFRFFFKYDNLSSIWNDSIQYMIEDYPQFDSRIRFGIRWIMRG
jgi:hypothetical protein